MDPPTCNVPKLPAMVMCGDHPSFTKTELNAKEAQPGDKEKLKERTAYARISPTASRSERALSEHALRRRGRSLDAVPPGPPAPHSRALVQAALGSFRWPPYLLCVWVCVLVLTHALHCAAALLERALPALKKLCQYFRSWTEQCWKGPGELRQRVVPCALALATAALYACYGALCLARAAAQWAIEPLCPDDIKLSDYVDDADSKTDSALNT